MPHIYMHIDNSSQQYYIIIVKLELDKLREIAYEITAVLCNLYGKQKHTWK